MPMLATSFMTLLALLSLPQSGQRAKSITDFQWLSGKWTMESKGQTIEEYWTAPAGGTIIGLSRTVSKGKTVSFEFLRIEQRSDGIFYIAQPQGRAATEFRLVSASSDELVFANPRHDFPQKIRYRRNSDGSVTAQISDDSGNKHFDFPYSRVP